MLLDPGPGSLHALGAAGVAPTEVTDVLLTHFHPDHVCGLVPFLFCLRNPRYRDPEGIPPSWPRLIGPEGLGRLYGALRAPFEPWLPAAGTEIEIEETDGSPFLLDDLRVEGELVDHLPSSLAWRITDIGGASFTFSGDTAECPGVVKAARGADLLFLECSAPRGTEVSGHLDPASASRTIRTADPRRVVLIHLNPECDDVDLVGQFDGDVRDRVELGRDGAWYELAPRQG